MTVQQGDQVRINLAPFIGSQRRNRETIPCRVMAVAGPQIEVRTAHPFREFSLWVEAAWVDAAEPQHELHTVTLSATRREGESVF